MGERHGSAGIAILHGGQPLRKGAFDALKPKFHLGRRPTKIRESGVEPQFHILVDLSRSRAQL
jgi:hypothetical protein